jgi:hypothetical protein
VRNVRGVGNLSFVGGVGNVGNVRDLSFVGGVGNVRELELRGGSAVYKICKYLKMYI